MDAVARAQVIAVSVDPEGDTQQRARRFVEAHGMSGRMEYLIGSKRELAPIWRAYGIAVGGSPENREVGRSATVRGITGSGRQMTIYPQDFLATAVAHDIVVLADG